MRIKKRVERILKPSPQRDARIMMKILREYQDGKMNAIRKWLLECKYARLNYRNAAAISIHAKIDEGIYFPHGPCGIFVSIGAQIGKNCTIFQNVTIATNATEGSKNLGAPIIGNDVFIGASAVILGGVHVGNHVRIGANATVIHDVPDNSTVVSGGGMRILENPPGRNNSFRSFVELKPDQLKNRDYYS